MPWNVIYLYIWVQGWRSGESTLWPGFDSQTRCHNDMWVEFVGSLLCTEKKFSPGNPVSPLLKNQHLT